MSERPIILSALFNKGAPTMAIMEKAASRCNFPVRRLEPRSRGTTVRGEKIRVPKGRVYLGIVGRGPKRREKFARELCELHDETE